MQIVAIHQNILNIPFFYARKNKKSIFSPKPKSKSKKLGQSLMKGWGK